jgi:hypothetical protein
MTFNRTAACLFSTLQISLSGLLTNCPQQENHQQLSAKGMKILF